MAIVQCSKRAGGEFSYQIRARFVVTDRREIFRPGRTLTGDTYERHPQQVLARQKATVNSLVAAQSAMFAGFEKLVDLNLKVVRATLDEVAQQSQQAAELKDPQDVASFTSGLVQPRAPKRRWPMASMYTTSWPACSRTGPTGRGPDRRR